MENEKQIISEASKSKNRKIIKKLLEYKENKEKKAPVNKILNQLKELIKQETKNILDYKK